MPILACETCAGSICMKEDVFDGQISAGIAHLPTNTRQLQCSEKQVSKYEPRHEETGFLHMRKQRRRSASR